MYRTIAIAVSGHGHEREHIRHGVALAQALEADLRFVHVTTTMLVPTGYATGGFAEVVSDGNDACRTEHELEAYVRANAPGDLDGCTATWEVRRGDCIDELVAVSRQVDLLVLGHHHAGFLHIFLRTDDERVLERAACPVVIVPDV